MRDLTIAELWREWRDVFAEAGILLTVSLRDGKQVLCAQMPNGHLCTFSDAARGEFKWFGIGIMLGLGRGERS